MKEKAVQMEHVSLEYNKIPILSDINLSIDEKEFVAVIGPNGGGKTTLLKIILGLIKPDKGLVKVLGKSPENARTRIGYLPQHTNFDPSFPMNVFECVLMGRYKGLFKNYSVEDKNAVLNALKTVKMEEYVDRQLGRLSGGQIQRVLIARTLVREPELLLLDEPMASIDPEMQNEFYKLLAKISKNMTIIMVSHDIGVVSAHVENIICLNRELFCHSPPELAVKSLADVYQCPVELIAHGIPHRVLDKHVKENSDEY
ncbi:MAG: ABC transporter ATP-binding protein [Methanobacteriaceae archaeon]|nr:ABC transporter ATP-binding protein [Methanobacteriaceae archaeon]